jgi:hypothetical protein
LRCSKHYHETLTAQAAFQSWLFYIAVIAASALVLTLAVVIFVVAISTSRNRDD